MIVKYLIALSLTMSALSADFYEPISVKPHHGSVEHLLIRAN